MEVDAVYGLNVVEIPGDGFGDYAAVASVCVAAQLPPPSFSWNGRSCGVIVLVKDRVSRSRLYAEEWPKEP